MCFRSHHVDRTFACCMYTRVWLCTFGGVVLIVCLWFIHVSDVVIIGGYMLIVLTFGAYVSSGLLEIFG